MGGLSRDKPVVTKYQFIFENVCYQTDKYVSASQ